MDPGDLDRQLAELEASTGEARQALLKMSVERCDTDQLKAVSLTVSGLQNVLDGVRADIARRGDELRRGGGGRSADDAVNPDGKRPPAAQQADKDRGDVFDRLPGLEDATKSGDLSGRYADIVARALKQLDREGRAEFYRRHQNLAEIAVATSEHAFRLHIKHLIEVVLHDCGIQRIERQRRNRKASIWNDLEDGMVKLRGCWDPDTGARITAAVEAEVNAIFHAKRDNAGDTRSRDQVMADAVANLLCGTPNSNQTRGGGTTVLVITDDKAVADGVRDTSVHEYGDGTPVPHGTLQRLATDPDTVVRTVTVNRHGVVTAVGDTVLDEGRNRRFATTAQRLALRAMYRTCMIPGCTTPFASCEVHHLRDWDQGGPTDMQNLGPLCAHHHHVVHGEGWQLRLHPVTRALTIIEPTGRREIHAFHGLAPPGTHHVPDQPEGSAQPDGAEPPPGRRRAA